MVIQARVTLMQQVDHEVRDWIADGTLQRGTLYSVQQLSDRMQVSRSPVREALLGLSEAGLIQFVRNRGFLIVVPSGRDIAQIFALRLAIEPTAAAAAARRDGQSTAAGLRDCLRRMHTTAAGGNQAAFSNIDQDLHAQIIRAAGNERAVQIVAGLRDATRSLGASTARRSRSLQAIADDHGALVAAIAAADPYAAHAAMRAHVLTTGRLLIDQSAQDGDTAAREAWQELVEPDRQISSPVRNSPG